MILTARRAALAAGAVVRRGFSRRASFKSPIDLVTQVDLASEAVIRAVLGTACPDIPVLGEEQGGAWGAATRWLVDPLDGTTNFVHDFPFYCVSIALQVDGRLELGVVYDPVREHLYEAVRGEGATRNGGALRVSRQDELDQALLVSGFAYDRRQRAEFYLLFVRAFLERAQGFRRTGSAAMDLCHVAAGQLDGYWEFGLKPWDVAAGALIVQEAGGRVTDMDLGPLDLEKPRILVSNGQIHDQMARVILPLLRETGQPVRPVGAL